MGSLWRHYCISSHKPHTPGFHTELEEGGTLLCTCAYFMPDISPPQRKDKTLHTHAVMHTHTYTHSHTYADSHQNLQRKGSWKSEVQEAQE